MDSHLKSVKTMEVLLGQYKDIIYLNSGLLDFVNEIVVDEANIQPSEAYVFDVFLEEIRNAEQIVLDRSVALSIYSEEEYKLFYPADTESVDRNEGSSFASAPDVNRLNAELKPPPSCMCCLSPLKNKSNRRVLSCGHVYCTTCITTRCRMGVSDRSMVPAHCCRREFPTDYVKEALGFQFEIYERFLKDKSWRSLDLQSDHEYANVIREVSGVQCPGCGVGVQKVSGCNHITCLYGHEFCYSCCMKWKTCGCET
ncbi:hypothetical protein F443_08422 [Plasmopara halstedii]|uniref:RING-type domain-containing protein n=1 Tax=Plasmopara halstedii TaxID=4781 RepID=A0A0P1ADC6_PLAHL|nr:hypothetical protein F443_08422 [Plasmopara halstedii]CEG38798.1 hypothetical protein F443_08422 [Plasmopara halstedii]|eukprot:XP_024575167.1 hypothetical protein F443_08422 [Plasmopara halstedii]